MKTLRTGAAVPAISLATRRAPPNARTKEATTPYRPPIHEPYRPAVRPSTRRTPTKTGAVNASAPPARRVTGAEPRARDPKEAQL